MTGPTGRLNSAQPYALDLFRIVVGLVFLCHGAASLLGVLGGAAMSHGATILASGSMSSAYFDGRQKAALWPIQNGGELPVLFCWSCLLRVCPGSGAFALDGLLTRRSAGQQHPAAEQTAVTA